MFLENRELIAGYCNSTVVGPVNQKQSLAKTLINGDFGLGKTFLIYFFLMIFFVNMGIVMMSGVPIEVLGIFVFMVWTLFAIPLHIGIYKAANKYRGPKVLAILAKINVKIHIFSFIWVLIFSILYIYIS